MKQIDGRSAAELLAQFEQLASDLEFYACVVEPFGAVKIKCMSLRMQFDLEKIEDRALRVAKSIAMTLCSAAGDLIFDPGKDAHLSMIADYPRHLLNALLSAQAQANGLGDTSQAAALKN